MIILLNNIKDCFAKIVKRSEFGKATIVVFVAYDTDALCAWKILSELLVNGNLLYRVFPVSGFQEMSQSIESAREIDEVRTFIFINCAAIYNMTEYWFAEEKSPIKTFIFDNHQPIHDSNANSQNKVLQHCQNQIYVIDDGMSELRNCPTSEDQRQIDILNNDSSSDEGKEDKSEDEQHQMEEDEKNQDDHQREEDYIEDSQGNLIIGEKRRRKIQLLKRKLEKKVKTEQVKKLQDKFSNYYDGGHYYSRPTSTVMYSLSQQLSISNNNLLWYALLGLTDQYLNSKLSHMNYEKLCQEFMSEVLRLNQQYLEQGLQDQNQGQEFKIENANKKVGVIFMENDYKFFLLRQQSLLNAMYFSNYVGSKLNLWNNRDNNTLNEIIAKLGIPVEEARQIYKYMHPKFKVLLKEKMMDVAQKYGLNDLLFRSFVRQIDSKVQITASDMSACLSAILEFPPFLLEQYITDISTKKMLEQNQLGRKTAGATERSANFWCAFDTLDMKSIQLIEQGTQMALEFQKALVNQGDEKSISAASYILEKRELFPSKTFRYSIMKNETILEKKFFQHPQSLQKLALLLMEIQKESRNKGSSKPIILCSQVQKSSTYLVVGVVGAQTFGTADKNQFGHHFMRVVKEKEFKFKQDNFETSIIEISVDDFIPFLDELIDQH